MKEDDTSKHFETARPKLLGLAYRILGTIADAEDAVQDTYLKWLKVDCESIDNAGSWLTTACTRTCLDILKSAHHSRVSYIGTWLPEPINSPIKNDTEAKLDLATSLTTAFLLVLERLTPKERAAYLLYEIFDTPYSEIAYALELRESACRKLVSRAKINISKTKARSTIPLEKQDLLLQAFKTAIAKGDTTHLANLLSEDVRLSADGGGKVPTIHKTLCGNRDVIAFLINQLRNYWAGQVWQMMDLNGSRGALIKDNNSITATVSFAYDDAHKVTDIYIMRNPEKISQFNRLIVIH